jgi:hypothetical protein
MPSTRAEHFDQPAFRVSGGDASGSQQDGHVSGEAKPADHPVMQAAHLRTGSRSRRPAPLRPNARFFDGDVSEEATGGRFDSFEAEWRRGFGETSLAARYRYEQLAPAYRHGGVLALSRRLAHSEWSDIERFVRRDWEQRNPGTWEQAKEAIRYAWHSVRARFRAVGDPAA